MPVTAAQLYEVVDATWPARRVIETEAWTLRDGDGGGKRVSAATVKGAVTETDIDQAEEAMRDMGQDRLFMLREGDGALDAMLVDRGYQVIDAVTLYACPTHTLTQVPLPRVTAFCIWEPLAIMLEIWAAGGIGPARIRVMDRAQGPKTAILSRRDEKPAGAAFAALHDGIAMVHAVEVLPHQRRKKAAEWMMRAAAFWAEKQGAHTIAVVTTDANVAANTLYTSMGFAVVGHYHYRIKPEDVS
jgi:GNAT superfamily N-acetyltransferase